MPIGAENNVPLVASLVSIIMPVYNEQDSLTVLLDEINRALTFIPHEIIAVDDGSTDDSAKTLARLAVQYAGLRVVSLERRSGQSAAVAAGFDAARGDIVVTLDADGQHDPADIPRMLLLVETPGGPDAVMGFRASRIDSSWKRAQSRIANSIRDIITGDHVRDSACSLRVMRRSAVMRVPRFNGMHRFLPTLLRMGGEKVIQVPINHRPRLHGKSKYGMLDRAARGLLDSFGVRWLRRRALHYRVKPPSGEATPSRDT
jgi:glycosyltransferase involved in cell wall biosynthesis